MPPLEDPEEALKRYFLAGPAGPEGQGTSSSLFNVLHVRCEEPPDYAEQLGESPPAAVSFVDPSFRYPEWVVLGMGMCCPCRVGLPVGRAVRWRRHQAGLSRVQR